MFIAIALLFPPQPAPPVYYQGTRHGAWINQLGWDENPEKRKEAAIALGEILRTSESPHRLMIVQCLGHSGEDAKPAVPALEGLLAGEDRQLREAALEAIKRIDPKEFARISAR
jgi:hypothetical protein